MGVFLNSPLFALILVGALFAIVQADDANPVVVGGNMLFDTVTSERFYPKGITYGYEVEDSFKKYWKPAMDNIASIPGVNTVRIYNVNPAINAPPFPVVNTSYDEFMSYLQSKGLYVLVPLTPGGGEPWGSCPLARGGTPPLGENTCYPSCLLSYAQSVINIFAKYSNTLSFIIGNEVMNSDATWAAAPCVKAFARDVKAYMNSCKENIRPVPLTYSAADTPGGKPQYSPDAMNALKASYLSCDSPNSIDIYGLNVYRWCSDDDTVSKVYGNLLDHLDGLSIPVIMTEFDCSNFYWHINGTTKEGQRDWKAMTGVLSEQMSNVFSGGTAYTYGAEAGKAFAFYTGGNKSITGTPGYTKSCGYPDNVCVVDLFAKAIAAGDCTPNKPLGDNVCVWKPTGYNRTVPTCPSTSDLPGDVTAVPPTRQDGPGYIKVSCPAHTLSPTEIVVSDCEPSNGPSGGGGSDFLKSKTFKIIIGAAGGLVVLGVFIAVYRCYCKKQRGEYSAF